MKSILVYAFITLIGCACSSKNVGADGEPQCVVCAPEYPFWRACESVHVASGGQPVCDEPGPVLLCLSVKACHSQAASRQTEWNDNR